MGFFRAVHRWGGQEKGGWEGGSQSLSHISCNYETWHSCTLPKKDTKNI